jgi:glycosyltransferase involved in cell wall biosynthesis
MADQRRWIELQGPSSAGLLAAIGATDADVVAFSPYLYEPTVLGLPLVGRRAVFHPAAHDEPPLLLPLFADVFGAAAGLVYHARNERLLVERRFDVATTPQILLGLGVDDGEGDPAEARAALGLGDRPYLLYVGRVDDGKGARAAAEFFAAYKRRRPGPLALVFAGPVRDAPPDVPDLVVAGPVDEPTKWGLFRGATAFLHPSAYESFGLVLMEAWLAGIPALVNGRSEVLADHCRRSGGGLWFDGYASFEAGLDRLLGDDGLRASLGAAGRRYVDERFRWPRLVARYRDFVEGVAARA